ncbi:MAG: glycosyltransferase family 4 protein [Thiohalomonadales bacterium]
MKILELCLSDGKGGLELYVYRTSKALRSKGIDCLTVVGDSTFLQKKLSDDGLPSICLDQITHHIPIVSAIKLANLVNENQIDVIHVHWGKDLLLASLAKRFSKRSVKLVFTRQMMITRPKKDFYHRFLYAKVDLYIAITEELRRLAQLYLPMPNKNIIRLYYGVEQPDKMTPQQRKKLRASWFDLDTKSVFVIGIVGRIEEQKGQSLLIQAVQDLIDGHASVALLIIGPPMQQFYLDSLQKRVQECGLGDVIKFLGSHSNPMQIMAAMDCLVLATRMETFGLVLAEAMRANVAVIGSNAGGVPEIIDHADTGLLFESNNVSDLTKQLRRLADDKLFREKIAIAGKIKADREFCHERHYEKLSHIFLELLEQ